MKHPLTKDSTPKEMTNKDVHVTDLIKQYRHMKYFTALLILAAIALIAYNSTLIDYNNPFEGDSTVALIGIFASLCAIILILILAVSKKIEKKLKDS